MAFDPTRLYSALLNTGLQNKDNALYQVIHQLIGKVASLNISSGGGTVISGGGGTVIIQGTMGPPGIDGSEGSDGDIGPPGLAFVGSQGITGSQGPVGPVVFIEDGIDGLDGHNIPVQGPQGTQGPAGMTGPPAILLVEDGLPGEDGFSIPSSSGSSSITFVRKLSDESASNNTFQNDDELFLAVGANDVWQIEILLFVVNASNTPDIKVQFTGPAAAVINWAGHGYTPGSTTQDTASRYIAKTLAGSFTLGVLQTATEALSPVRLEGMYIGGGTAGTLQLQWAQSTTDGANPTTVKAGSYLKATKVS